jgi:hypothetical protein
MDRKKIEKEDSNCSLQPKRLKWTEKNGKEGGNCTLLPIGDGGNSVLEEAVCGGGLLRGGLLVLLLADLGEDCQVLLPEGGQARPALPGPVPTPAPYVSVSYRGYNTRPKVLGRGHRGVKCC